MIDWILHRPPHASNASEKRMLHTLAGRLASRHLAASLLHLRLDLEG